MSMSDGEQLKMKDADFIEMDKNATPFLEPNELGNLREPISGAEVKV